MLKQLFGFRLQFFFRQNKDERLQLSYHYVSHSEPLVAPHLKIATTHGT